jgi:hypothetical protein
VRKGKQQSIKNTTPNRGIGLAKVYIAYGNVFILIVKES